MKLTRLILSSRPVVRSPPTRALTSAASRFCPFAARYGRTGKTQIERQLLLRNTVGRAQPGSRQPPDPLHGIDVDFMEAVAVFVACACPLAVTDGFVAAIPLRQVVADAIFIIVTVSFFWCRRQSARSPSVPSRTNRRCFVYFRRIARYTVPARA